MQWLCLFIRARPVGLSNNNNNATKASTKRHKSRKGNKANATSSADNTENEQEPKRSTPSPYSTTSIAIIKRSLPEIVEDNGNASTTQGHHIPTDLENEVLFNTGITIKPASKIDHPTTRSNTTTSTTVATATSPAYTIKIDNIYGTVYKNNGGYNATSNNNNNKNNNGDPYGGSVANKYGYYGGKSFASGMLIRLLFSLFVVLVLTFYDTYPHQTYIIFTTTCC